MYKRMKYRLKMLHTLISHSGKYTPFLFCQILMKILVMATGFISPLIYKQFIEKVIIAEQFSLMPQIIAGYSFVYIANCLFAYLIVFSENKLINSATVNIKEKMLKGFFGRKFSEYNDIDSGYMKTKMEDDTLCIEKYFTVQSTDYIISLATLIIATLLLIWIDWKLAIFAVVCIPVTIAIDYAVAKRESVVLNANRENSQHMASWLHSSIQGWREVKALNLQKHEDRIFMKFIHIYAVTFGIWINYWVFRILVIPKIKDEFLMKFAIYFFGGLLVIGGDLEIAALLVFMQYYALFAQHMQKVSEADAELISGTPQSDRLLEELDITSNIEEMTGRSLEGYDIRLENVSFSYAKSNRGIFDKMNLTINEGERVAITGRSGAGKTTLLNLIAGILTPDNGSVSFANQNVKDIVPRVIHEKIGFIMQENILINDTIKENLLYANPFATETDMKEACKKAYILNFIEELPEKFDTIIGERGIKLSGGQKQRLILARQFLRNVDVYIFDEATSSLDQHSENIIREAIYNIDKEKTIIVVAHRESSIALCDRRICIDS